jgi:hypothetical protein
MQYTAYFNNNNILNKKEQIMFVVIFTTSIVLCGCQKNENKEILRRRGTITLMT